MRLSFAVGFSVTEDSCFAEDVLGAAAVDGLGAICRKALSAGVFAFLVRGEVDSLAVLAL